MHRVLQVISCSLAVIAAGCQPMTVRHQVDPIHITLDVNLKVDRELDEFFDFEQEIEEQVTQTAPTPPPVTTEENGPLPPEGDIDE